MKKHNFILIGFSIILQLTGFTFPVIGIGKEGLDITNIPLSLVASLLLLMFSLRGLYKDTHNQDFYAGFILSIVGIGAIIVSTIISPILAGGRFIGCFEWYSKMIKYEDVNDDAILLTIDFIKSFKALYMVISLGSLFYSISLIKFMSGLFIQNVENLHLYNMRRTIKIFAISSFILVLIATIILIMFTDFLDVAAFIEKYNTISQNDELRIYIYFLVFCIVLVPAVIVFAILYFINIIKSIVLVFKTPKKIIKLNSGS